MRQNASAEPKITNTKELGMHKVELPKKFQNNNNNNKKKWLGISPGCCSSNPAFTRVPALGTPEKTRHCQEGSRGFCVLCVDTRQ